MNKIKVTWKIGLLIALLLFSLISIFGIPPKFLEHGVVVTSINSTNNSFYDQGLRKGMIITSIDGAKINNMQDLSKVLSTKFLNGPEKTDIITKGREIIVYSSNLDNMTFSNIPKTNLALGLDLAGGSRALVQARNVTLTQQEMADLIQITSNRLNAFGLTDLTVAPVSDLNGNKYMLVEIAGATPSDLRELLSKQGEFEAKIGNQTVFVGGNKDVTSVGQSAQDSGIQSCSQSSSSSGAYTCTFRFTVTLSPAAAQRQYDILQTLTVNQTPQGNYLSKKMNLYLDGKPVQDGSLLIGQSLQESVTTQIQISGSGTGQTQSEAVSAAQEQMKLLQTVLMTGSLPFKLQVVKLDTISPTLGSEFSGKILLVALLAILIVALILFIRYRKWKSSLAMMLTMASEVVIILGVAAFIKWNLDLPSIAGILATIGTGVDDLVVIMDESIHSISLSLKQRLKRAFTIIMGSYFTGLVSLLPLMWAGAGLLKGFAITTIIGISVGVFVTRPAFSDFVRQFRE